MAIAEPATAGWTAAQTVAVIAPIIGVGGAIILAALTYWLNQRASRRERRAKVFADALAAVEDYAEMPYRIRRRPDAADARHELTAEVSTIQSRLAFHQAWMQIEAPDVAVSYDALVRAAKNEAGRQMSDAWRQPVLSTDAQMNLGVRYPRGQVDAARATCIKAMLSAQGHKRIARKSTPLPAPSRDDRPPGTTG